MDMDHSMDGMDGMGGMDGMDGMDGMGSMGSGSSSGSSQSPSSPMSMSMMGVFHWSSSGDGVWLSSWVPNSEPNYIGACIGLFLFAIMSRGLLAAEIYFVAWVSKRFARLQALDATAETRLSTENIQRHDAEKSGRNASMSTEDLEAPRQGSLSSSRRPSLFPEPLDLPVVPPFSWSHDTVRSFLTVLASFVNYLLMMVVMTGNGGFFICIVCGIFVGELVFGRFRSLGGFRNNDHIH